jgi:CxxC motif-containing protein (DUF1111 family)
MAVITARVVSPGHSCTYSNREVASSTTRISVGGGHAVRAYTDLKRHDLCDGEIRRLCNEERRQDNVPTELFLTAKLWDAASSAPYGHRGDLRTLSKAIVNHGGEARPQREAFLGLPESDKRAVIAFLCTLGRRP